MTHAPKNDLVAISQKEVKIPGMKQPTYVPDKKKLDPEYKNTLTEGYKAA
jgi:hypothetical protein